MVLIDELQNEADWQIHLAEAVGNMCFGEPTLNRIFIDGITSLYSVLPLVLMARPCRYWRLVADCGCVKSALFKANLYLNRF